MPYSFQALTGQSSAELCRLWHAGTAPDLTGLSGWIFRGRNTAPLARLAGNGPFAKGFLRTSAAFEGCNFPVKVHRGVWSVDTRRPFGFFRVEPIRGHPDGDIPAEALLIDYGRGRAGALRSDGPGLGLRLVEQLARALRDILVRPPDAADGVYLGRAFYGARARLHVSYFVLERWKPLAGEDVSIVTVGNADGRTT